MIGHRDVPGKPELLGTTREFLDYFSLKKLDDLPTLAQLKELEDLRVQLSLPGAEATVEGAQEGDAAPSSGVVDGAGPGAEVDSASDDDERDANELDAAEAEPRARGLVARGAGDDAD